MDAKEAGRLIARKRRELGLSQEQCADLAEVSRNYLSLIERGEALNISTGVLERIAAVLRISASDLLTAEESNETLISPSLRQWANTQALPFSVIDKLARIPKRGSEPTTPEQWEKLYVSVKAFIE